MTLRTATSGIKLVRTGAARRRALGMALLAALVALAAGSSRTTAQRGGVWLVSRAESTFGGGAGTGLSTEPSISDDGLRIAFASEASDLIESDTNGVPDIFLFERPEETVRRISLMPDGSQPAKPSMMPSLSPDGRWLALRSEADLMGDGDGSGVFLIELDGDLARYRIAADTGHMRGTSYSPIVSRSGERVAYLTNLSPDGRTADAWVRAAVWDRRLGASISASPDDAEVLDVTISDDGSTVAFATASGGIVTTDPPDAKQVYARNVAVLGGARLEVGPAEMISVGTDGRPGELDSLEPSLSADGSQIAFTSYATNLVPIDVNSVSDIFVRDRAAATTIAVTRVNPPDTEYHPADSAEPDLSPDGTRVTFASGMRDLVPDDRNLNWDIFVHDLGSSVTLRVNLGWDGREADRDSSSPVLSDNEVAFVSMSQLASADTDDGQDVYLVALDGSPAVATHPPHPTPTHDPHPTPTAGPPLTSTATLPPHPTSTAEATAGAHPTATSMGHPTATSYASAFDGRRLWLPVCGSIATSDR